MTFRLALRSLLAQPVRAVVLACGFGLGIGAMAGLLGIGEVILEQSRSPALRGGGDVLIEGITGAVPSARFLMSGTLASPDFADRVRVVSPSSTTTLYWVEHGTRPRPVRVTAGIPSLERALGDAETSRVDVWRDTAADSRWTDPEPADVLRGMDRFHAIPDVRSRAATWAEWLYFNGRNGDGARFYLTFLVGPHVEAGKRDAVVRLQIERDGTQSSFSTRAVVDDAKVLDEAPDLAIGANRVELVGLDYRVHLDLEGERGASPSRATGDLVLRAVPGRALPPFQVRGVGGWVSGYVVPVMSGELSGELRIEDARVSFEGGTGYHDHNWGFWGGVTWQWGQVAHDDLSLVYGRIIPPADAFDAARLPGFLVALGPEGLIGQATDVQITEMRGGQGASPSAIRVEARGSQLDLALDLEIVETVPTRMDRGPLGTGGRLQFFQMQARCRVTGRLGPRTIDFDAPASAETFGSER